MLLGVLRMPSKIWSDDPIDIAQRESRYVEAADEIERLDASLARVTAESDEALPMPGYLKTAQVIHSEWMMCPDCKPLEGGPFLCGKHARDAVQLLGCMHQDYTAEPRQKITEGT
jgi:hypothetical protein